MFEKLKKLYLSKFVKVIFEDIPFIKKGWAWLDGHKTKIGRFLLFLTGLLAWLQTPEGFPELFVAYPWLASVNLKLTAFVSWFLVEFGLQHQTYKNMAEEEKKEE